MAERSARWEQVYAARSSSELSWYQREATASVRFIETVAAEPTAAVIDIGGGVSSLVDRLLAGGYTDLTVLDISRHALDEVATRLESGTELVKLVQHDVLTWEPGRL